MKTKLLTIFGALSLMILSMDAQAISLRFKFKTFSSGPSIYACNAGIMSASSSKKVCYFEGTQNVCTPNDCTDTKVCNTRCVCSGGNGGDYLMNYGKVTSEDWKDNGDDSITGVQNKTMTAGQSSFSTAMSDSDSWAHRIKELSFHLGSELYGSSYFVDICYRGPQIEYFADNVVANFSGLAQASATDFLATGINPGDNSRDGLVIPGTVDGKKYSELAGLKVQAFMVCDLQGKGTYQTAHVGGTYNLTDNEAGFTYGSGGLPTGGGDFFASSSQVLASTSAVNLISNWINSGATFTPRFCKVRYVFTETNMSSALPNLRKWQRHGAEMCTYTKIEEDAE